MNTRRPGHPATVRVRRAKPSLRGNAPWSAVERKSRALAAHLQELGWKLHTVSVVREWDVHFGRKRRRLVAHAMCFDRGGWVFSITTDTKARRKRDELRSSPWLRELRARLGDMWFDRGSKVAAFDVVRAVRRPIAARLLFAELDAIVAAIEERPPRHSTSAPRGEPRAALVAGCRGRGWYLESVGHTRRMRVEGWPCVASMSASTRGGGEKFWTSILLHFESGPMSTKRPPEEARALVARGYMMSGDGFFLWGKKLDVTTAKRELALLQGASPSRAR